MDRWGGPGQALAHGEVHHPKHGAAATVWRTGGTVRTCPILSNQGAVVRVRLGRPLLHLSVAGGGGGRGSTTRDRGRGYMVQMQQER